MIKLMLEDIVPIYLEQEGKLHALSVGRGSAYSDSWCGDELQFTNVTASSFTVTAKYIHIADTAALTMLLKQEYPEIMRIST